MNTRRTSMGKLRLPCAANSGKRTKSRIPTIQNFFPTEEEDIRDVNSNIEGSDCSDMMPSPIEPLKEPQEFHTKPKKRVGARLSTFLGQGIPATSQPNTNDFETPQKNIKKAPKAKANARPKRQQKIKTAFLKNEEIFSEITAQHCMIDNINPDEMQMALALSMSEAETNGTTAVNDECLNRKTDDNSDFRDKLKKFGFRTTASEDYCLTAFMPSKKKTKWANRFTALTLRNPQRQLTKFNTRVAELLGLQPTLNSPPQAEGYQKYTLNSANLKMLEAQEPIIIMPDDKERLNLVDFYVLSLFEPSTTKPGHLLKNVRFIAGRDLSPEKRKDSYKPAQINDEEDLLLQSPAVKKTRSNESILSDESALVCPNSVGITSPISSLPSTISVGFYNNIETSPQSVPSTNLGDIASVITNSVDCDNQKPSYDQSFTTEVCAMDTSVGTLSTINALSEDMSTSLDTKGSLQLHLRPTSPDIFADSDVEMEAGFQDSHHITTYELFSSDEVKISSETHLPTHSIDSVLATIDLTQCGSDSSSQLSKDGTVSLDTVIIVPTVNTASNLSEEIASDTSQSRQSLGLSLRPSESAQNSSHSVDLTQTSDDEDILLSDDEVNYSIWKAHKSSPFAHTKKENIGDEFEAQNVSTDRILNIGQNGDFSFADLVTDSQPPILNSDDDSSIKTKSNTSLDLDLSKRSDFGILEEVSPFKTPTKTPQKRERISSANTSAKCRKVLSDSFISSPKECLPVIKRFSSSSKFGEFVKSEDENLTDLDDIAKLIYGSPSKKAYKKPVGLDQLLTGAINYTIESPKKPELQSPKEFEFNGRTYLVHTTNVSQKPKFEIMDETSLLDQLYKFGLKPLKRKQAVKMLEYIYNQTHPWLVDEKDEISCAQTGSMDERNEERKFGDDRQGIGQFNLHDCSGCILVSEGDTVFMEIEDEQYVFQTNTSKRVSTALLPFHIAWYNLVKSNKKLHEAILHYEPIDLQEIYLFFKSIGYRYDPKELKYFFDSRSIIFRYDLNKGDPSAGTNRHVRRKRTKLTQQPRL